jgi:hypothetical protein
VGFRDFRGLLKSVAAGGFGDEVDGFNSKISSSSSSSPTSLSSLSSPLLLLSLSPKSYSTPSSCKISIDSQLSLTNLGFVALTILRSSGKNTRYWLNASV